MRVINFKPTIIFSIFLCLKVMPGRYDVYLLSPLQSHSTLAVAETAPILSQVEGLFSRALILWVWVAAVLPSPDPDHSFLWAEYTKYDDD